LLAQACTPVGDVERRIEETLSLLSRPDSTAAETPEYYSEDELKENEKVDTSLGTAVAAFNNLTLLFYHLSWATVRVVWASVSSTFAVLRGSVSADLVTFGKVLELWIELARHACTTLSLVGVIVALRILSTVQWTLTFLPERWRTPNGGKPTGTPNSETLGLVGTSLRATSNLAGDQ
jgi:hypothetical protein